MAEAIRDGLRLEAIAADIAGDGDTALEMLGVNAYDIAVLDRDIPGQSGDEIARRIVASGQSSPEVAATGPRSAISRVVGACATLPLEPVSTHSRNLITRCCAILGGNG